MKRGITFSCFDLLHAGHVMMLREAREQCDWLICGLHTDPTVDRPQKNKPIQTIVERYTQLAAVRYVDEIIVYTTERDVEDILQLYNLQIRILGTEYIDQDFTGRQICLDRGIELCFNKRDHRFSTSALRKQIKEKLE